MEDMEDMAAGIAVGTVEATEEVLEAITADTLVVTAMDIIGGTDTVGGVIRTDGVIPIDGVIPTLGATRTGGVIRIGGGDTLTIPTMTLITALIIMRPIQGRW